MLRKLIMGILLVGLLLSAVSCTDQKDAENTTENYNVTFAEDMTLDALHTLLLEKGSALRFSDIPEKYAYVIPMPMVPQLAYPIDENTTFYIMQISEDEYSYVLTVRASNTEDSRDYSGVQAILSYLENR